VYEAGGKRDQAEQYFRWGFRASRRFSARDARMRAAHGLFRLARAGGDAASAAQFALAAQRAYEPDVRGGPDLLLDLARFWTDQGEAGRAGSALLRLAPSRGLPPPSGQLAAAALAARAFYTPGVAERGWRPPPLRSRGG
jgi:hypothetical protein